MIRNLILKWSKVDYCSLKYLNWGLILLSGGRFWGDSSGNEKKEDRIFFVLGMLGVYLHFWRFYEVKLRSRNTQCAPGGHFFKFWARKILEGEGGREREKQECLRRYEKIRDWNHFFSLFFVFVYGARCFLWLSFYVY